MPRSAPSLGRVALFAVSAHALMRLRFDLLAALLERARVSLAPDAEELDRVEGVVERVLARRLPLVRHTCLTRSVTRYYFLRRAGADVELVFGLGKVGGSYEGHCWVMRDGEPYREQMDPRPIFTPVYAIPRHGRG
jgi:transglutaminase superfamily protein